MSASHSGAGGRRPHPEVITAAGFTRFRRIGETPFNAVYDPALTHARRAVALPPAFTKTWEVEMPVTETGTRARQPDSSGFALTPDGLRLYYEVFGDGPKTIVFLPANPIVHSRLWKAQVHYLARHFRVVVYDGRGNGLSDHPDPSGEWFSRNGPDGLPSPTVMDATGTEAAVLAGICGDGVFPSIQLAVSKLDHNPRNRRSRARRPFAYSRASVPGGGDGRLR